MANSKAPLEFQVKGYPFAGQELILANHSSSIPESISQDALFALPYIGLLVGIDELTPSKAVYGIYDASHPGLRFVRGDGTFISQHQVCFLKLFNDGSSQHPSQRAYFHELVRRSAIHCYSTKDARFAADCRNAFPTLGVIKNTLLYVGDLKFGSCPALQSCKKDEHSEAWDAPPPDYFPMTVAPQWNFDPNGFQASVSGDSHDFDVKYLQFCTKYRHLNISPLDFQHAAFCLVGLEKAELISFSYVGTNNVKYFKRGLTPPMAPKLMTPLKTYQNWTVDCFLARFNKYQKTFQIGDDPIYERFPNPVLWLEAQMEYEEATGKITIPRKMHATEKGSYTDDSIISWEFLKGLKWETRGRFSAYPKPFVPLDQQPLRLHDIVDERTFKFKESERAKKERREKKKAAKKAEKEKPVASYMIDFTDGISSKDHMHGTAVRNHREIYEKQDRRSLNGTSAASSSAIPGTRKRKLNDFPQYEAEPGHRGKRQNSVIVLSSSSNDDDGSDDNKEFPSLEEMVAKNSKPSRFHASGASKPTTTTISAKRKSSAIESYSHRHRSRRAPTPEVKVEPFPDLFAGGDMYDASPPRRKKKDKSRHKRQRREDAENRRSIDRAKARSSGGSQKYTDTCYTNKSPSVPPKHELSEDEGFLDIDDISSQARQASMDIEIFSPEPRQASHSHQADSPEPHQPSRSRTVTPDFEAAFDAYGGVEDQEHESVNETLLPAKTTPVDLNKGEDTDSATVHEAGYRAPIIHKRYSSAGSRLEERTTPVNRNTLRWNF